MWRMIILLILVLTLAGCGPGFQQHTADEVVDAFTAAGLPVESPETLEYDPDDLVPDNFEEGIRFEITSIEDGGAGRVFTFAEAEGLELMQTYYEGVADLFFTWVYAHDNALLVLDGNLSEEEAQAYLAVLEELE